MNIKNRIKGVFNRQTLTLIFGLAVALIIIFYWQSCNKKYDTKSITSQIEAKAAIKENKKQLPKLQEEKKEVNSQIKVLAPKREKEIQKIKTLKHDSVPCPEILTQCETIIQIDSVLIKKLLHQATVDSSIIAVQSAIMTNQEVVIDSQANEITALKKKVRKHRFQKFLIVTAAVLTGGLLIAR